MATSGAFIDLDEGAAPATPAAGKVRIYAKTDGSAYQKDDAGTETGLATATGVPVPPALVSVAGTGSVAEQPMVSANDGIIIPAYLPAAATITGVFLRVVTSNGNISVALYDSSLNRLATSGSVACPATGQQTVSFSASYAADPGWYYLGLSANGTTATFRTTNASGQNTLLARRGTSQHPLPDPFVVFNSDSRCPIMVGLISGGWAP